MISEKKLVTALGLEVVVPSQDGTLPIEESDVCRPGLQLTGFWDYFAYERPQLFGKVEMAYLSTLDADTLAARLKTFFSFALPCVIVCRGLSIPEAMLVCARERRIPVYRTQENTVRLDMAIINYLNTELAPRRTQMLGYLGDYIAKGTTPTNDYLPYRNPVFIDRSGNVLACYKNVRPWRMCSHPCAWAALERPSMLALPSAFQRVPA